MSNPQTFTDVTLETSVAEQITSLMSTFYQAVVSNVPFTEEQSKTMVKLLLEAEPKDALHLQMFPSLLSENTHRFLIYVKDVQVCSKEYPYEHLALFEKEPLEPWVNETIDTWFKKVREKEYYRFHASSLSIEKVDSKRFTIRIINNAEDEGLRFQFNVGF